ncbi:MAG: family 20 glycosylhydrolase [Bacteroidota bacterium]
MKRCQFSLLASFLLVLTSSSAQTKLDDQLPIRGFCIAAPSSEGLQRFITFIDQELAPQGINTLILRVDYRYQYKSHPELVGGNALTEAEVKQLVAKCREHSIKIIPQFNLLGHQSWHSELGLLLKEYPEFDETPHIDLPAEGEYQWPNEDGLYCKSYCPLHPEVHDVVFALVDELLEVFETDAFHAGLDEVFYIADDKCPRCGGRDPAELFAVEVTKIRNHVASRGATLWMWGDRLIDGKATGIGMWEASMNNTHRAIDMIPKDIVICDWHYERADPTAVLFASKGFSVVSCPWRKGAVAVEQVNQMRYMRSNSSDAMKDRFQGVLQTVWTSADNFLDNYYAENLEPDKLYDSECYKELVAEWARISQ